MAALESMLCLRSPRAVCVCEQPMERMRNAALPPAASVVATGIAAGSGL